MVRNRSFFIVLLLIGFATLGLLLFQYIWVKETLRAENDRFDQRVNQALEKVVSGLESNEMSNMLHHNLRFISGGADSPVQITISPQGQAVIKSNIPGIPNEVKKLMDSTYTETVHVRTVDKRPGGIIYMSDTIGRTLKLTSRRNKMEQVFDRIIMSYSGVSEARMRLLQDSLLHEMVKKELAYQGITGDFEVTVGEDMSILNRNTVGVFTKPLFPNDLHPSGLMLNLRMPGHFNQVLQAASPMLMASLLLSIAILAAFGWCLWYMVRQKKLSAIKSDFINNMTHELRTPIATISLAVDAIQTTVHHDERIRPYADIIRQENKRMNQHIEQVLQMALIENNRLALEKQVVNMHAFISDIVAQSRLRVEDSGGRMETYLKATQVMAYLDVDHFGAVLRNLFDNAAKYTNREPLIIVRTRDEGQGILIEVEDNGRGIGQADQERIFEKFYRVSDRNLHQVKGFGLGLSFVKAIVEAHGGTVGVSSEPDKGSVFRVWIPV